MSEYFPAVAYTFIVKIGGSKSSFQEVSGLDIETEVEPIKEGGENNFVHQVPGRTKFGNLVLKRGMMYKDSSMFSWIMNTLQGDLENRISTKDILVELLDPGNPDRTLVSWNIKRAYPVKWSFSGMNSMDSSVFIETIEFAYHGMSVSGS